MSEKTRRTRRVSFQDEPKSDLAAKAGYRYAISLGRAQGDILASQLTATQQARQQAGQQGAAQQTLKHAGEPSR